MKGFEMIHLYHWIESFLSSGISFFLFSFLLISTLTQPHVENNKWGSIMKNVSIKNIFSYLVLNEEKTLFHELFELFLLLLLWYFLLLHLSWLTFQYFRVVKFFFNKLLYIWASKIPTVYSSIYLSSIL